MTLTRRTALALDPIFFDLLAGSYFRLLGERLVPSERDNQDAARWLYEEAPYCVLAHDTDPDPIFIYGNKTAQTCFEYSWDELTFLRSRLSAEESDREERQRLLDAVNGTVSPLGTGDCELPSRGDGFGSRT
jgi:MEKHLA domain